MAVAKRLFLQHGHGVGDEDRYYLARDTDAGRVFVYHEWSRRYGDSFAPGNADVELDVFLAGQGAARAELLRLIGSLVEGG